uniref:Uncharacterized protein n=1 Tax=Avena sativa TaxID=4498 RepID=A0ACD5W2C0_AVESA
MGGASRLLSSLLLTSSPLRLRPSAAAFTLFISTPTAASRRQLLLSSPSPLRTLSTSAAAASPLPYGSSFASPPPPPQAPLPEWSHLVDRLAAAGYAARGRSAADEFAVASGLGLSAEAESAVSSCLAFARDRPDLLRSLPRKDVEVVVANAAPALFKDGEASAQRLQQYLAGEEDDAMESVRAETVDIVRYLLSYAYSSSDSYVEEKELTDSAVRNILAELVNSSGLSSTSSFVESAAGQGTLIQPERSSRPPGQGQNIEMKRGDWICTRCSFMNFARNARCLECNEHRPKKMLTGGEWECPQCDFYNYGRNMSCLRCECKRPASVAPNPASAGLGGVAQLLDVPNTGRSEIERKLAENDEKAERWLSKVSQLDDSADLSSLAADEDFPEIMPMRKGVNKFVVSTRKTPLERRLASAQYSSNNSPQAPASDSKISQTLDRILGRSASTSAPNNQSDIGGVNAGAPKKLTGHLIDIDPVPFVPLSPDLFAKPQNTKSNEQADVDCQINKEAGSSSDVTLASTERRDIDKPLDDAEKWSKKVAELDNVNNLSSAISDEDFPEIMPMRKGENRFVISKKKDRSLASPQYKRRSVLEQADNSSFTPFVPFPPDYFAKKDAPAENTADTGVVSEGSPSADKLPETNASSGNLGNNRNTSQVMGSQASSNLNYENWNRNHARQNLSTGGNTLGGSTDQQHQQQPHDVGDRISGTSNTSAWNPNYSQGRFNDGRGVSSNYQHPQQPHDVSNRSGGTSNTDAWNTNYSRGRFNDGRGVSSNYQHQQQPREVGDRSGETLNTDAWNTNYSQGNFNDGRGGSSNYQHQMQPHDVGGRSSGTSSTHALDTTYSQGSFNEGRGGSTYNGGSYSAQTSYTPGYSNNSNNNAWSSSNNSNNWSGSHPDNSTATSGSASNNPNQAMGYSSYGGRGYTGKSLEGSAVRDPDPLDMSEEAKAERWFRRAAQVKHIDDLVNIPDEDFPAIMPMRKGVNRFVVSKRKTPLERRLTSPQYRRNLPVVSSEPDTHGYNSTPDWNNKQ